MAMEDAVAPYLAWINATAAQAEQAGSQAQAAAAAYEAAFAMTVPPPVITVNRTQLASLVASNVFGQNTSAIAANEAQYGEMWAQDAAAMYGYAANSAAARQVTPFTAAPQTTNPAGSAVQSAAVTQAAGTAAGTAAGDAQASLSQISAMLQSLATPAASSTATGSGLSTLPDVDSWVTLGLTATSSAASPFGSIGSSLLSELLYLPAFFSAFVGLDALWPHHGQMWRQPQPAGIAQLATRCGRARRAGGAPDGAWARRRAGGGARWGSGAWGSAGDAPSLGGLSVPPNWAPAAAPPSPQMLLPDGMPLAAPDTGLNAGLGFPFAFGGLPKAAAIGAAAGVGGAAASKYASRLKVVSRPPAAGYPAEKEASSSPRHPVPAGAYPTNGHAPPGYRPAIVYLPTNGHEPAHT